MNERNWGLLLPGCVASGGLIFFVVVLPPLLCIFLVLRSCGAPIARTYDELFASDPDVIAAVSPYVAEWATLPPEQTEAQRREVGSTLGVAISVCPRDFRINGERIRITVVDIGLEVWYDWYRGLLYIHDNIGGEIRSNWQLRRLDEHWYVYNYNE